MEHYKTILSALSGAMPKCMSWVLAGTEEGMNARDIFVFAMEQGGENEQLGENEFYVVSSEGAIGFTTKYEYLTRWIFIPTEGEFREAEMQRLREELEFDHQQEEAEKAAAEAAAAAAAAAPEPAYQQPEPVYQQPGPTYWQPEPYQQPDPTYQQPEPAYRQPQPAYEQPQQMRPQHEEPQPAFCTSCGSPINPGAKFCRSCGARLD